MELLWIFYNPYRINYYDFSWMVLWSYYYYILCIMITYVIIFHVLNDFILLVGEQFIDCGKTIIFIVSIRTYKKEGLSNFSHLYIIFGFRFDSNVYLRIIQGWRPSIHQYSFVSLKLLFLSWWVNSVMVTIL